MMKLLTWSLAVALVPLVLGHLWNVFSMARNQRRHAGSSSERRPTRIARGSLERSKDPSHHDAFPLGRGISTLESSRPSQRREPTIHA